jgi:exopolysaccharide biosynthesis polyprenyl glycosylphosphotransferase
MSQQLNRGVDDHTHRPEEDALVPLPTEPAGPSDQAAAYPLAPVALKPLRSQYRRLSLAMALADVGSVAAGIGLALSLPWGPAVPPGDLLPLVATVIPVVGALFSAFHLYLAHLLSPAEEFRRLVLAVSLAIVVLVGLPWWPTPLSARLSIGASWLLALILVLATRRAFHLAVWRRRVRGDLIARTLVVGTNEEAARLGRHLSGEAGFLPVGLVATSGTNGERIRGELPILGHLSDLPRLVAEADAGCLFVASTAVEIEEMRFICRVARWTETDLRVTAQMPEVLSTRLTVRPMDGLIALTLKPVRLGGGQAVAKRLFDIALAGLALVLLLPLLVVIGAVLKITTSGPVLFRQQRVGKLGVPFTSLKFRTLHTPLESDARAGTGPLTESDGDVVPVVGRWLRRWNLDHLPQLFNVIKGEMSLVGPRPALPNEIKQYQDWHFERLEVRPGMTGLGQVSPHSELSFDESVQLDLFYIENWSLAYDLFIVLKSIPAVLRPGAGSRRRAPYGDAPA